MKKTIKILLAAIVLLIVVIGGFMLMRGSDNMETSLEIKNSSEEQFEHVGVVWEGHALICKSDQRRYLVPKQLAEKVDAVSVVGIKNSGELLCSGAFSLQNNKSVEISGANSSELTLNIDTEKSETKLLLPDMKNWTIETDKTNVKSTFSCDTEYKYTLYVYGKGGKLGVSDTLTKGEEAIASWEKPKAEKMAWVLFDF